ncbi:unnamed protein product [Phytophthora fragariaefolia]|uniref:Unnamed protein product n=1 Tax=Phytophthora fragariaefolia TaxID=1490495 RepID=A0A9W6YFW8_9STRA|nr:unnamed protein product [Phytophthora fragariaefolia]
MLARRETRADGVAFQAKSAGRAPGERQRLMAEHAAFLDGRREEEVDFGEDKEGAGTSEAGTRPDEAATGPRTDAADTRPDEAATGSGTDATAAVDTRPPAVASRVSRATLCPASRSPRRPPVGKHAAYRVLKQKAARAAAKTKQKAKVDPKKAEAKKVNAEKKAAAAKLRATRKEKNARAVARAEEAISRSAAAKEQRRLPLQAEEQRGEAARKSRLSCCARASRTVLRRGRVLGAWSSWCIYYVLCTNDVVLSNLVHRDSSNAREAASSSHGKRKAQSNAAQKQKRQRRAGDVSEEDEDADDEDGGSYESRNVSSFEEIEFGGGETPPAASSVAIPVTGGAESEPTPDNNELNSDLDGEGAGSEDWYTKEVPVLDRRTEAELDAEAEEVALGQDIFAGRRLRARQAMDRERMRAARAKLTRDLDTITDTWDGFTPEELDVLAQDPDALKKMRKTGWNFDPDTQPQRTEAYPGLYAGEYGPTDEVLEKAESPLELFFYAS